MSSLALDLLMCCMLLSITLIYSEMNLLLCICHLLEELLWSQTVRQLEHLQLSL